MGALRRLDNRVLGPPVGPQRRAAGVPALLIALVAGLLVAGLPAAYVVAVGGPTVVAALLPLLALVPVVLVALSGRD